jgi:hypothetical protein
MVEQAVLKQRFCNDMEIFREGFAVSQDIDGYFHITESGESAYSQRYDLAEPFQKAGWAWVKEKNGRWKRIDKNGKEVLGPTGLA